MAEIVADYITKLTRPSQFFACNAEKHGKAWGRGYLYKCTYSCIRVRWFIDAIIPDTCLRSIGRYFVVGRPWPCQVGKQTVINDNPFKG